VPDLQAVEPISCRSRLIQWKWIDGNAGDPPRTRGESAFHGLESLFLIASKCGLTRFTSARKEGGDVKA
jgi:hypothetical protein